MTTENTDLQIKPDYSLDTTILNPVTQGNISLKKKIIAPSIFAFIIVLVALLGGYYLGKEDSAKTTKSNNANKITITPSVLITEGLQGTATPTVTLTITPTLTQTVTPTVIPTATKQPDICVTAKNEILNLIIDFENYQKNQNATAVLALFTPAQSQSEIETYQNLSGEDDHIAPRLYNNVSTKYKTPSYLVLEQPTLSAINTCSVGVREQRSYYSGSTGEGSYSVPTAFNFTFIMVKQNDVWKVDRYLSQDVIIKEEKYAGFTMEYK